MRSFLNQRFVSISISLITILVATTSHFSPEARAVGPAGNILLEDTSGPGNQQNGYTNNNIITAQFDHDNTADTFLIDENPADPACASTNILDAPNTAATQSIPHGITAGQGQKNLFIHLVDLGDDLACGGAGGDADQFSTAPGQIFFDNQTPTNPIVADFAYDADLDSGALAVSIVDGGSGLDFQIVTSGTACNGLPANWNSGVDAGTGFGVDTAGIVANATLVAGAGVVAGENICIRVRDKSGNTTAWVSDGTMSAPTPPPSQGGSKRRDQAIQEASNTVDSSTQENIGEKGGMPSSETTKLENERILDLAREILPDDYVGHPQERFITDLYFKGILNPLKLTFDPDQYLNRAEMLKIVMTAFPGKTGTRKRQPFKDVDPKAWYSPHFLEAYDQGIITGYPDKTARPEQLISRVEALAILSRAIGANLDIYQHQTLAFTDLHQGQWYIPVLRWAVFEGIIDGTSSVIYPGENITRGEMAQMTSRATALGGDEEDEPCDCDKEKKAWEAAQEAADAAQAAADQAAADAAQAGSEADAAKKEADDAQKKVNELQKFFDGSSSATSGGETITTGDLQLLREANRGVFDAWQAGEISAQEASDAWGEIGQEKLEELRAQKKAELEKAEKEAADAKAKADAANKKAADANAKAAAAKKAAAEAQAAADAAKKAYDDCLKKCELAKAEAAAQRAQAEAQAAAAAAAAAAKKKADQEQAKRDAETKAQQAAAEAAKSASGGGGGGGGDTAPPTETEGGGGEYLGQDDPCKKKFASAVKARAQQILDARGEAPEPSNEGAEGALDLATSVGDAVASVAQTLATGGSNAAAALAAAGSVVNAAYGAWVNYVGDAIKAAGQRIIANSRICQYVSITTTDNCGHVTFSGQTVYYEKKDGKTNVMVMGPGDETVAGQCD